MEQGSGKIGRVFISYASPDREQADLLEQYLQARGIDSFLDRSDIRSGANWDNTIETALRASDQMVLLLSGHSMPYRKEVHREWFFFDQNNKRLHPLLLRECDRHSRMYAYNHIDATTDFAGALQRLVSELHREDYQKPDPRTLADQVSVIDSGNIESRSLAESLDAIFKAVTDTTTDTVLSLAQAEEVCDHRPVDVRGYRLRTIAELSLPRYQIFKRFINLTLLLDQGETGPQRWKPEDLRFDDLRDVLKKTAEPGWKYPAIVLLGAPGSGKSTLLRRLQLDHSIDQLRNDGGKFSYFIQLNTYRATDGRGLPPPGEWLAEKWSREYPHLPPLADCLREGRVLLLLDALNEMPHRDADDYYRLIGLWREFTQEAARNNNRIVFSCRSLDYSSDLSNSDLRVPQVNLQPMNPEQVQAFLAAYLPSNHAQIWKQLEGTRQLELYQTPYFLSLLVNQVGKFDEIPAGRAGLFTGYVRESLRREVSKGSQLFSPAIALLDTKDRKQLANNAWTGRFGLADSGPLFKKLSALAYGMQRKGVESESAQIRIGRDDATSQIDHQLANEIIEAGLRMNVLNEDLRQTEELAFYHQLLQEYFAARKLAEAPNPTLVHVEHEADRVAEPLEQTIARLAVGDPLPSLPQTGWEETTLTAAPMARDPIAFIRSVAEHNLALAARCAASAEIPEGPSLESLRAELRQRLLARTASMKVDLRARIAAGEALGIIGDPRFIKVSGLYGDYILPPMIKILPGSYPIGDNTSPHNAIKPKHLVSLDTFYIGTFPVTNAEYKCFIEAGGYKDRRWWDTEAAKRWINEQGEEKIRQNEYATRKFLIDNEWNEDRLNALISRGLATIQQVDNWIVLLHLTDDEFKRWIDATYPTDKPHREPAFWSDPRFNNPLQPVVGVTWFEARAYCNWLTTTSGGVCEPFRLLTEVEFEAAARGIEGRCFPYGNLFSSFLCNTFESHIRRTTPVGIFNNSSPEGVFDLSGNVWTWTSTIHDRGFLPTTPLKLIENNTFNDECHSSGTSSYGAPVVFDQYCFLYPWQNDNRERLDELGERRVERGGSWALNQERAHSAYRCYDYPYYRSLGVGFRLAKSGSVLAAEK